MGWPQYAYLAMTVAGVLRSLVVAGRLRTARDAVIELVATAISTGFVLWLLWAGGFFSQL